MGKRVSLLVLYYLRFWAKRKLDQIKPLIIGVTGSAGKSSCVAAIEAVLKEKFKVKTTGTTNSESGIPLAILGLKPNDYSVLDWIRLVLLAPIGLISKGEREEVLICEMGIDSLEWPKNMDYLLTIVRPKIGVFLNALPVHTKQMKSVENIFKEKSKLILSLPADGTAIVNEALPEIATKAKVIKFKDDGSPIPPAVAVGKIFGITKLPKFDLPPGRGSFFEGINGSKIIDSSYNASPVTMVNALEFLKKTVGKRKIAVLGDMRELGDLAEKYHREISQKADECANMIITVGPLCKQYFFKSSKLIVQWDNYYQAGEFLQKILQEGDVVLFKGSQNTIFLEGAVEMVLKNKKDADKLCRRGSFWEKQRRLISGLTNVIRGD